MRYRFILFFSLGAFLVLGAGMNFVNLREHPLLKPETSPEGDWQVFDSLMKVNQPNTAREVLWSILEKGIASKSDTNIVKAFQHFSATLAPLEPDERVELYVKLDSITTRLHQPAKSLATTVLVGSFVNQHRYWVPYGADPKPRIAGGDTLRLGSTEGQANYVFDRLERTANELSSLQSFSFGPHKSYLLRVKKDEELYPTVFDYVAHQLIAFYHNYYYTRYYELKHAGVPNEQWFLNPDAFIKADFAKPSLKYKVLSIYQKLEAFHLKEKDILSKNHYQRLLYATEQLQEEKREKWQSAFDYYGDHSARSKFLYEIARLKYDAGKNYHFRSNPAVEKEIKEAYELLKKEMRLFPNNDFSELIQELIRIIEQPQVALEMQNMAYPGDPLPVKFKHANIEEVKLQIYTLPKEYNQRIDYREFIRTGKSKLIRETFFNFTDKGDFQTRETSTLLDPVEQGGDYFILITEKDKSINDLIFSDSTWRDSPKTLFAFTVTEILVKTLKSDEGIDFLVTDYKSGEEIEGAKVEIYYDRNFKILPNTPNKTGATDGDGWYRAKISQEIITYIVTYKQSKLSSHDYFYDYHYEQPEDRIQILTDRAIYRPGQTVYFKLIAYKGKDNDYKVKAGESIEVKVYDNSWNDVYTTTLITNDFGSLHGSFVLPMTGSLGQFTIESRFLKGVNNYQNYSSSFLVEEYKRPTFEAMIEQPEGEAKLNDSVKVIGKVKAFAGYPVSGAKVNYKIYRTWNTYWRYYGANDQGRDLVLDRETVSDENGEFNIEFHAKTDPNSPEYAYYNFEIIAEVSDISGETHEARTDLNLSKTGLQLTYTGPSEIIAGNSKKAVMKVLNMAGKEQEGYSGEIKVYRTEYSPQFQSRIWSDAEFKKFDEEKWKQLFPYSPLSNFDHETKKEVLVRTVKFKVGDSIEVNKLINSEQGNFRLEAYTLSREGDTIRTSREISVIDLKSKELPKPAELWSYISSSHANVGETIKFQLGSSFRNAQAYVQLRRGEEVIMEKWVYLKDRKEISYTISEKDRGNISYHVVLIYDGKAYTESQSVYIPFDNKELVIKTKTFRNKLLPGQKEEWRFTLTGKDAEKIAAEICAGMYDASLDQFSSNSWSLWPYYGNYYYPDWRGPSERHVTTATSQGGWYSNVYKLQRLENHYRKIIDMHIGRYYNDYAYYSVDEDRADGSVMRSVSARFARSEDTMAEPEALEEVAVLSGVDQKSNEKLKKEHLSKDKKATVENNTQPVQIRENFNETAFFLPDLRTNEKGEFVVEFTLPESLTEWKFMALAHTKELKTGNINLEVVAQKPLMVTSNAPRFFRSGDRFDFASKVVNLTDSVQEVEVELTFFDPVTEQPLNLIGRQPRTQRLSVPANQSKEVIWNLDLTDQLGLISYKITAANNAFSDGEQKPIPVLSNRQLITEAFPFVLTEKGKSTLTFSSLKENKSQSLRNERVTFEYTSNPAWSAVLALPYLQEYPYECSEQVFSRYYANSLARNVIENKPKIKTLFETWRSQSPEVFMSQLEKNEQLKTVLLEETPWVLEAKSESERRKRIGELFEMDKLSRSQEKALRLLKQKQNSDGGFGWFGGNRSNVYITQHIVSGFGHLKNLGIDLTGDAQSIVDRAISFLNDDHVEDYKEMTEKQRSNYTISSLDLHWLYSTAYFKGNDNPKTKEVKTFLHGKLAKHWSKLSLQQQAMAGMYFLNQNDQKYSQMILASLRDRAKTEQSKGTYFPENDGGYYWDEDKIVTQALIIEFFSKAGASQQEVDKLRLWLILQKRSNAWESTKSTALATYALLLNGTDYLEDTKLPVIRIGSEQLVYSETVKPDERFVEVTPGLGHLQTTWSGGEVNKNLAEIIIDKPTATPSYGAVYWKYFEDMSKVKASSNAEIQIRKTYRKVVAGDKGDQFVPDTLFKVGDRVSIELVVTVKNDLEFVHIKDLRPAGFEPKMGVSRHFWRNGLWYYQSPRDVSMNYFIDNLPKGTHVFTYEVFVTNSGRFDSGNATVQCMYAPEFVAHSGGDVISVGR
ncbi:MAG: alpha-2-macroglobulin family protein [Brumimicrobium sp.]|nr:alpha-2-macroglobulin family protein [Brumimicrobium sp.]